MVKVARYVSAGTKFVKAIDLSKPKSYSESTYININQITLLEIILADTYQVIAKVIGEDANFKLFESPFYSSCNDFIQELNYAETV